VFLDGDLRGELPETLSELGLYPAMPSRDASHPRAIAYTPRYPLWSNGSEKERFVVLPEGETIDMSAEEPVFPEGTLLFKTFAYDGAAIETRVLRLEGGEWIYAVYQWSGDDATRLDLRAPVPLEDPLHEIPSRLDCVGCHESDPNPALGFDALQLADQLDALPVEGATPRSLDEEPEAVLGYFVGNCVHCHNGVAGPNNGFDLRPEVAVSNLVGVETMASGVPRGLRVAPGDPESSVVYQALLDADGFAMPPSGVQVRDTDFAATLADWIRSLE